MLSSGTSNLKRRSDKVENTDTSKAERVQLHLSLPYKHEPRRHPKVQELLDRGLRIVQLQRISDHEVLITLDGNDPNPQGS